MLNYVCPVCQGTKFRDNSAYYLAMVNGKKQMVFEHSCYKSGCEGILFVACDTIEEPSKNLILIILLNLLEMTINIRINMYNWE